MRRSLHLSFVSSWNLQQSMSKLASQQLCEPTNTGCMFNTNGSHIVAFDGRSHLEAFFVLPQCALSMNQSNHWLPQAQLWPPAQITASVCPAVSRHCTCCDTCIADNNVSPLWAHEPLWRACENVSWCSQRNLQHAAGCQQCRCFLMWCSVSWKDEQGQSTLCFKHRHGSLPQREEHILFSPTPCSSTWFKAARKQSNSLFPLTPAQLVLAHIRMSFVWAQRTWLTMKQTFLSPFQLSKTKATNLWRFMQLKASTSLVGCDGLNQKQRRPSSQIQNGSAPRQRRCKHEKSGRVGKWPKVLHDFHCEGFCKSTVCFVVLCHQSAALTRKLQQWQVGFPHTQNSHDAFKHVSFLCQVTIQATRLLRLHWFQEMKNPGGTWRSALHASQSNLDCVWTGEHNLVAILVIVCVAECHVFRKSFQMAQELEHIKLHLAQKWLAVHQKFIWMSSLNHFAVSGDAFWRSSLSSEQSGLRHFICLPVHQKQVGSLFAPSLKDVKNGSFLLFLCLSSWFSSACVKLGSSMFHSLPIESEHFEIAPSLHDQQTLNQCWMFPSCWTCQQNLIFDFVGHRKGADWHNLFANVICCVRIDCFFIKVVCMSVINHVTNFHCCIKLSDSKLTIDALVFLLFFCLCACTKNVKKWLWFEQRLNVSAVFEIEIVCRHQWLMMKQQAAAKSSENHLVKACQKRLLEAETSKATHWGWGHMVNQETLVPKF